MSQARDAANKKKAIDKFFAAVPRVEAERVPTTYNWSGGIGGSVPIANAGDIQARNDAAVEAKYAQDKAAYAKSQGNKEAFTYAGGRVDPNDPWGFYRESAGDKLAQFTAGADPSAGIRSQLQAMAAGEDPSNLYRDKLQQMSSGTFGAEDPSYRWRFDQGQQALERSLGARGLLDSGNAGIELQAYGQGAASQEYGAQFDRTLKSMAGVSDQYSAQFDRLVTGMQGIDSSYNNQFNRLASMAGITLSPTASGQLANQAGANQVQAQGNQLDYSAKMSSIANDRQTQQDDMGLQYQYQQGRADAQAKAQTTSAPTENIYDAYSGGGGYSQGDPTPSKAYGQESGTGFVVRTS